MGDEKMIAKDTKMEATSTAGLPVSYIRTTDGTDNRLKTTELGPQVTLTTLSQEGLQREIEKGIQKAEQESR